MLRLFQISAFLIAILTLHALSNPSFAISGGGETCSGTGCGFFGGTTTIGEGGGCGSCAAPIEPDARKLYDSLKSKSLDELSALKSDPAICEKLECFGQSAKVAQNIIDNAVNQIRFEASMAQSKSDAVWTRYLSVGSLIVALFSLLVTVLSHRRNRPSRINM